MDNRTIKEISDLDLDEYKTYLKREGNADH